MSVSVTKESIRLHVTELLSRATGIEEPAILAEASFYDCGIDSLMIIAFSQSLQEKYDLRLSISDFFYGCSVDKLTDVIYERLKGRL